MKMRQALEVETSTTVAGNEGLGDIISRVMGDFKQGFAGSGFVEDIDSAKEDFSRNLLSEKLIADLEEVGFNKVKDIPVYRPERLKVNMQRAANTLTEAIDETKGIAESLLLPVAQWFEKAVTEKDFREKIWTAKEVKPADIDGITDKVAKLYDKKRNGEADTAKFRELYPSVKVFKECGNILFELRKKVEEIDLDEVSRLEDRLTEAVRLYQKENLVSEIPKDTSRRLAVMFRHIGDEMELLTSVIVQAKKLIVAYSDTLEGLEEDLKELEG